ncbi:MAG: RecX family transcriptional regulator [Bacteroidales bacterium]|nr:RecX family transcriptional regulator [Bacteroidales bacterium]MBN2762672.1 RecX family transcriptional regulator [Bacteroidales bacterium]
METDVKQVLKKLQQICSRQEKCASDIVDYLLRHQIPREHHASIIESLTSEKFIDEERYARAAVQDKFRFNRWGKIKIRFFLRSKKIGDQVVEKAMAMIDDEEYKRMLEKEIKKKALTLTRDDRETRMMKLLKFATSKGFEQEVVWPLLKNLT